MNKKLRQISFIAASLIFSLSIAAQTTEFSYQGSLRDGGVPASGAFQMRFSLFDAVSGGNQIGSSITDVPVTVAAGAFSVKIDFGSSPFTGADRFLEIAVRHNSGESYSTLTPRQQISSSPYSIKSITADNATDSSQLGGISATNYLLTDGDASNLKNLNGGNIASGTVTSTQLAADALPSSANLKLLGSLRWDLLKIQTSFTVGTSPTGVAFDGANMWVTNSGSSNVSKIRVSDGANLGTFPVGTSPLSIAFDGANVWVANSGVNNVTKLRASDGADLGTFPAGTNPIAIAFDGANVWVVNDTGAPFNPGTVTKLRASDGANQGTFTVGIAPTAIVFDGAAIWVANASGSLSRLRASDGANLGAVSLAVTPQGIAFDGSYIWVAGVGGSVYKLRAGDGGSAGSFAVGSSPRGLAFDGANIWVTNSGSSSVTKLRASDGTVLSTYTIGANPRGIAFDGANMWIAIRDGGNVTRMQPAFPG
jgi:hypothetical protein